MSHTTKSNIITIISYLPLYAKFAQKIEDQLQVTSVQTT